ncbi:MAG: hypothetical protein SFU84_00995 [Gemmatimonadales bacterium]|nr:hypothetical protein [Gemmatimonadales bacterium]
MNSPRRARLALSTLLLLGGCLAQPDQPPDPSGPVTSLAVVQRGVTNATFLAAWAESPTRVWFGGQGGVLLRWDGNSTQLESTPSQETITGIWGAPAGVVRAVTGEGGVWRRGGESWSADTVLPSQLLGLWGLDDVRYWTVGSGGAVFQHDAAGWRQMPTPTGTELWSIWGTSENALIAVGNSGTVLECCLSGGWQRVEVPTNQPLFGVTGDGAGRVVAVGASGTILLRDGTGSWRRITAPTAMNLFRVEASAIGDFTIVGDGGRILRGDGEQWSLATVEGPGENLRAVAVTPTRQFAAGWFGTILDNSDGWRTRESGAVLFATHVAANGSALAVGLGGLAFERLNGTWRSVVLPTKTSLYGVDGAGDHRRLVVGDSGTILRFEGGVWRREASPYQGLLRSVWWAPDDRALVVGAEGTALRWNGGSWQSLPTGTDAFLRHVWAEDWADVWAVGDSGTVIRWDGVRWRRLAAPTDQLLRGVWGRSSRDVWVAGEAGVVLHWDGGRWTTLPPPTTGALRAVRGDGRDIWVVGEGGAAWRWDGSRWSQFSVGIPGLLIGLGGGNGVPLVMVGEVALIAEGRR